MAVAVAERPDNTRRMKTIRHRSLIYLGLAFYGFLGGFPVYLIVITIFKNDSDLYNMKSFPLWFNEPATWDHLDLLIHRTQFTTWLTNTMMVALVVSAITIAVG